MSSRRKFITYEQARELAKGARFVLTEAGQRDVAWRDQAEAAMDDASLRMRGVSLGGGRGDVDAMHAAATFMQVAAAAASAGRRPVTCQHTAPEALDPARGITGVSPVPMSFTSDPYVFVCAPCALRPDIQRQVSPLQPQFPDECDRCGHIGALRTVALQSGMIVAFYGACEACVRFDQSQYVARESAFGPIRGGYL